MEEQEEIRAGFRSLVHDSSDSEAGEEGISSSLLKKRKKTTAEQVTLSGVWAIDASELIMSGICVVDT